MYSFVFAGLIVFVANTANAFRVPSTDFASPPHMKASPAQSFGDDFVPQVYNSTVYDAFAKKTLLNPMTPSTVDPYSIPDFNTTWPTTVCAVRYPNPLDRSSYFLENYADPEAAKAVGAFVTHLNPCGFCSSTRDLAVYMNHADLTNPVRTCALVTFISMEAAQQCLMDIGFTSQCALIWLQNAMNTRKECLAICLQAVIEQWPNNMPANSTTLNPCLQCDEDKSGPIFKVVSGRTRRNSGLKSAINRPDNSVYPIYHYYY